MKVSDGARRCNPKQGCIAGDEQLGFAGECLLHYEGVGNIDV